MTGSSAMEIDLIGRASTSNENPPDGRTTAASGRHQRVTPSSGALTLSAPFGIRHQFERIHALVSAGGDAPSVRLLGIKGRFGAIVCVWKNEALAFIA